MHIILYSDNKLAIFVAIQVQVTDFPQNAELVVFCSFEDEFSLISTNY